MLAVEMPPRKVVDMPEEQFVGALEREVERLLERVVAALREGERSRSARDLADEAERLLAAGRRRTGARGGTPRRGRPRGPGRGG